MREYGEKDRRVLGPGCLLTTPELMNRGGGLELLRRAFATAWGHKTEWEERGKREEGQGYLYQQMALNSVE